MRIAILQLDADLGDVKGNIEKADSLLFRHKDELSNLDLLVLPELALAGKLIPQKSFSIRKLSPGMSNIFSYTMQAITTSHTVILSHISS
jgi:hypothetical protein